MEKVLLTSGENKIRSAIYALKDSILKLGHGFFPVNLNCGRIYGGGAEAPPPV